MQINYLGHSCFLLTTKAGTRVVTDPYGDIGYPMPSLSADFVTVSHDHYDHCNVAAVGGDPVVYRRAGESKAGADLAISAFASFHDDAAGRLRGRNLIFSFTADGVRVVHLGDLGEPDAPRVKEFVRGADVLLIPVGGRYTIDAAQAAQYVRALRPPVVIPMHYKTPDLNIGIAGLEEFLAYFAGKEGYTVRNMREFIAGTAAQDAATQIITLERCQYVGAE